MSYVINEHVFKYTVRNGKLFAHEGDIVMNGGHKYVDFKHECSRTRCPKTDEFGIVHTNGPSLWLTERDDKLAASLFIEFEEQKLAELQRQIVIKTELINALKGDLA